MNKRPVFFFPTLNPDHAPESLPDDVLFMSAGLDYGPATGPTSAFKAMLPFSPQKARMVLDEMLSLGFNLGPQAAFRQKSSFLGPRIKDHELKAIQNFAEKGESCPEPDGPNARELEQTRQDCQKVLLLAWEFENRRSELSGLEKAYLEKVRMLRRALGDDDESEDFEDGCREFEEGFDATPDPPDWQIIAGAGLAFLPDGALLLTDSEEAAADLAEINALGPVPHSVAEALGHWSNDFRKRLAYACLPGWKLAGRGKRSGEWPWLKSDTGILIFSKKPYEDRQ